jgi:hypothetical protein
VIDGLSGSDLTSAMQDSSDAFENEYGEFSGRKKKMRDVEFEMEDIMGAFDIDDFGNIVFNADRNRDNFNRLINKHGYLIDRIRNIIN